jgi:hypothetical protein
MSNFVYDKTKEAILNGDIDFSSNIFKLLFINTDLYVVDRANDLYVSDVPSQAIVYTSVQLSNITNSNGTIDAEDVVFSFPPNTGFDAIVLFQQGSSNFNSILISYIDTAEGLPFEAVSTIVDGTIAWSNSLTKILSL